MARSVHATRRSPLPTVLTLVAASLLALGVGACADPADDDADDPSSMSEELNLAWSRAQPIPVAGTYGAMSMLVDSGGKIHVAAVEAGRLYYLTNVQGTWTRRFLFEHPDPDPEGKRVDNPVIALDENDRVSIAYELQGGGTPGGSYGIWLLSGVTPTGPAMAAGTKVAGGLANAASLKTVNGTVHLAYEVGGNTPGLDEELSTKVFYTTVRADSAGFTNPQTWQDNKVLVAGNLSYANPAMRVGDDGRARIVFTSSSGLRYRVAKGPTSADGLDDAISIPGTARMDSSPKLVLEGNAAFVGATDYPAQALRSFRRTATGWTKALVTDRKVDAFAQSITKAGTPAYATAQYWGRDRAVRFHTLKNGTFRETTIAGSENAKVSSAEGIQLRIPTNGKAVLLYIDSRNGKIMMSTGS